MLDTDTRQLRRRSLGEYTAGSGKMICSHCGGSDACPSAFQPRISCTDFIPAIPFSTLVGTDRLFNTVRVGRAWHSRLVSGQHIALYDTTKSAVIGLARVIATHVGYIHEMLEEHAHANHLMLDKEQSNAASDLYKWQLRNYGPRIIHEKASLTAIYLLRDDFATAEAVLTRRKAHGDAQD